MSMMQRIKIAVVLGCIGELIICASAHAGLRRLYSDNEVIQKAELIVIGRLDNSSIKSVACDPGYQEYEAVLMISIVLKGTVPVGGLKIVIHHGLDVVRSEKESPMQGIAKPAWKGGIEIWDTGNSLFQTRPIAANAEKDAIWFLGRYEKHCVKNGALLGIEDPEDIQPAKYSDYFKALMAPDQRQSIEKLISIRPEFKERAEWFTEMWAISDLVPTSDCKEKITRLVPYLNWATCEKAPFAGRMIDPLTVGCAKHMTLVKNVLGSCDNEIGPVMTALWKTGKYDPHRRFMAGFLGKSKYLPAIPLLEGLIKEENQFFSTHPLKKGWLWQQGTVEGELIYENYSSLRAAMRAMKDIGAESSSEEFKKSCAWWLGLEEKPIPPDMPCGTN